MTHEDDLLILPQVLETPSVDGTSSLIYEAPDFLARLVETIQLVGLHVDRHVANVLNQERPNRDSVSARKTQIGACGSALVTESANWTCGAITKSSEALSPTIMLTASGAANTYPISRPCEPRDLATSAPI